MDDSFPSAGSRAERILRDIGLTITELERFPQVSPDNQCAELKDALRSCREDSHKKDELIQRLCGIQANGNRPICSSFQATEPAKIMRPPPPSILPSLSEVAALQVKVDTLEDKLRHKEADLRHRDDDMAVLRKEMDLLKEENTRLIYLNQDLTRQANESKQYREAMEAMKARNEFALNSLQDQYRGGQEKIAQLEARLRSHLIDRDEDHKTIETWQRRFGEFVQKAAQLVCVADLNDVDTIMSRMMDLGQENAIQRTKMETLTAELGRVEREMKAAKDTVTRLTSGPGPDSTASIFTRDKDYKLEVDRLTAERDDLKAQIGLYETRVKSLQTLLDSSKAELAGFMGKQSATEADKRQLSYSLSQSERQYKNMLESLATLLGTANAPCLPEEAMLKDRINKLITEAQQQQAAAAGMEQRVRHLQQQFETQYQSGKELELKTRLAEVEFTGLREKVKQLEQEMAARDVLREGVLAERERLAKQIKAVADCLKLSYNPLEFDPESTAPKIIAKCEELLKGESSNSGGGCQNKCSHHHGHHAPPTVPQHHQRIRQLNELIASREQEISDLQRKLTATEEIVERFMLESRSSSKTPPSKPLPLATPQNHIWMEDKIRELTNLLKLAHDEMGRLKTEILEAQELKMATIEQHDTIQKLEESLSKMEKLRDKQSKKFIDLKKDYECGMFMEKSREDKLQLEVNRLREHLDTARRRERQLLEFRAILARLMGIDLRLFATAGAAKLEAEVINRVQRMLEPGSHNTTFFEPFSQQRLSEFTPEFRKGYEHSFDSSMSSPLLHTPTPPASAKLNKKSSTKNGIGGQNRVRHSGSLTRSQKETKMITHYQSLDPPPKSILKPRARSTSPPLRDDRKY